MKKQIAKLINGPVGNLLLIAGAVYFVFDFFDLKITQNSEVSDNIGEESKFTADINGVIGGLEYNEIENWCRKKDSNNIMSFNDCMKAYGGSTFVPEKEPDVYVHQGITYTASKVCPDGKSFVWNTQKGFLRKDKVYEVGCLTPYELESLKTQARSGGGGNSGAGRAASERINRQTQQNWNNINQNYRNDFRNWQMKEFGY